MRRIPPCRWPSNVTQPRRLRRCAPGWPNALVWAIPPSRTAKSRVWYDGPILIGYAVSMAGRAANSNISIAKIVAELHSGAVVLKNSLRIEDGHYNPQLPRAKGVQLFKRHVELVEVETTSYCNRTCSFCPNAFIDRRRQKTPMPEACWSAIIEGLRELDYQCTLVWSRYSEPLSEERIVERLREVRRAAPRARLAINSNGDYLNQEYLARLRGAGLNRLGIDVYMPDDEPYSVVTAREHLDRFLKRIGMAARERRVEPELVSTANYGELEMIVYVRNLESMKLSLSDRGGLVQLARKTKRVAPCFAPFKHLVIDWDGSVMACCQLRSDAIQHRNAVVARIGAPGIGLVEAYVALAEWRKPLRSFGPKAPPCAGCNVSEYSDSRAARAASVWFAQERLPGAAMIKSVARRLIPKVQRP